jgi:hypothetical protein
LQYLLSMNARAILVVSLLAYAAGADESLPRKSPPPAAKCEAPPAMVVREIERLFKSAAEHATHSNTCVDGHGERVSIELLATCVERSRVAAHYRVTVAEERGGECSPYPDCAKPSPPEVSTQSAHLDFARDGRLIVPRELPGVPLKTPLDRAHSTGCYGDSPAFVPRPLKP